MKNYFTKFELILWISSVSTVLLFFCLFDRTSYMTLIASALGVTSLILNAKGNPLGMLLMVIFSILYGIISFGRAYYGEMITYMGMTLPMSVISLVAWLCHPYKGKRSQVSVNRVRGMEYILLSVLTAAVTVIFYFVLKYFNTANLIPSTVSVSTSFAAAYLTFRRSPWFAVAYAINDVVLLVLWTMAAVSDTSYISVIACFFAFLVNDIYGFVSWRNMEKKQRV